MEPASARLHRWERLALLGCDRRLTSWAVFERGNRLAPLIDWNCIKFWLNLCAVWMAVLQRNKGENRPTHSWHGDNDDFGSTQLNSISKRIRTQSRSFTPLFVAKWLVCRCVNWRRRWEWWQHSSSTTWAISATPRIRLAALAASWHDAMEAEVIAANSLAWLGRGRAGQHLGTVEWMWYVVCACDAQAHTTYHENTHNLAAPVHMWWRVNGSFRQSTTK